MCLQRYGAKETAVGTDTENSDDNVGDRKRKNGKTSKRKRSKDGKKQKKERKKTRAREPSADGDLVRGLQLHC